MSNRLKKMITNPYLTLMYICEKPPFNMISDKKYLEIFFRAYQGYRLDLKAPVTFNEKIQWLKLYDRKPIYTELSDKYLVRDYISRTIGEQYLIPSLGVWTDANDIDFDKLPNQFVLKCNHDSGSIVVCTDKGNFDRAKAIHKLNRALHTDYYWHGREYNYKKIDRRIIAEEYISDDNSDQLTDYKFFCFDGEPRFIQVDVDRFTNHVRNYYDTDWKFIDVTYGCKNDANREVKKPLNFDLMIHLARQLSQNIPHVRWREKCTLEN